MTITLPNLDDRDFDDLVAEVRSMIPQLAPSWTDHNPSDPGITLIELFAYISEMLMYRANCITDANKRVFLELLMGKDWLVAPEYANQALNQQIIAAIKELRTERRAITNADFEAYAKEIPDVAQAYCRPLRNYENTTKKYEPATAHVSIVIIPENKETPDSEKDQLLISSVKSNLESRKLLTTQLHVVFPEYYEFRLNLTITIFNDYKEGEITELAEKELERFFDPIVGGAAKQGWQPGQPVYFAEIYTLLDQLSGVDFIDLVSANSPLPFDRELKAKDGGNVIGIKLNENELPQFNWDLRAVNITIGTANHND